MFNAMFLKNETWLTRRMRITYVMNKRKYLKFFLYRKHQNIISNHFIYYQNNISLIYEYED